MLNADIPQARIPNLVSRRQAIRLPSGRNLEDSCLGNLISQEERSKGSNVIGSPLKSPNEETQSTGPTDAFKVSSQCLYSH